MSAAHALLPPSGAAAWVVCAGWVLMNQMYPEDERHKQSSAEGVAAHWAFAEILFYAVVAVGLVAPNGVALTQEMIDAAQMFVDAVDDALRRYGLDRTDLHVEQRVAIPSIHHEHNWGTPDVWFYAPGQGVVVVLDFKFGHEFVDVFENWQLVDYAAGVIDTLGLDDQATRVELVIVQPRSYHRSGPVRSWSCVASDLRPMWNKLRNAAEAALMSNPPCVPNPACLHCSGRHSCEALLRDAYRSADIVTRSLPLELTPHAVGLELDFLKLAAKRLEGRITGLEEQAKNYMQQGQRVPFFAMVPTTGREVWNKPPAEVMALGELFGKDLSKPRDVITPNQARELFKKAGLPQEVIAQYSERKTALTLERDDGKEAKRVFYK